MNNYNRTETRMTRGIAILLNNAIKMLVATGAIGKVSAFADVVGLSEQQLVKILNGITPITLEEFWHFAHAIQRLDRQHVYRWLVQSVFMDQEIKV